jgi:small basic protein
MPGTESNDTFATADDLTEDIEIQGQLSSSSDVDWFQYTVTGAASLNLAFDLPSDSSYTDYFSIQILEDGDTIYSGVETGKDGSIKASIDEAGTYYVKVTSTDYYHDSGQYGLTLTEGFYDDNYEQEHNGYLNTNGSSSATGTRLTNNQTMSGQLFDSSDTDFYYINAAEPGSLTVLFDPLVDSSYTDYYKVTLQDSNFNTLSSFETGKDGELTAAVEAAGRYWAIVQATDYYHTDNVYGLTASVSSQTGTVETESNDTFATADDLTEDIEIQGQLSSSSDVDWFQYTVTGAASLNLAFDLPSDSSYTDYFSIQILEDGDTIYSGVETGKDGSIKASIDEAGTYYVKVTSTDYYHDSGQYGLTLTEGFYDDNYEQEHNGYLNTNGSSSATGTRLTNNQTMSGQLFDSSDTDFYYINAAEPGSLTVLFDPLVDSSYTDYYKVTLQDSNFNTLSSFETGKDGELTAAVEAAGRYWAIVQATDYYHTDNVYGLTASVSSQTGTVETESNDTFATADDLTEDIEIQGQLSSSSDVDWFQYTVTGAASLNLAFDLPSDSSYTDYFSIQILEDGDTIYSGVETGKDGSIKASIDEAGTYYVKVTSTDYYHDSGQYGLTLTEGFYDDNYEQEHNGYLNTNGSSSATGTRLTNNQTMSGQLFDSSDTDFYYINAAEPGSLTVLFDPLVDSSYTDYYKVTLQDSNFNTLSSFETGKDGELTAAVEAAGRYWAIVQATDYYHTDNVYGLTASVSSQTGTVETESNDTFATADDLTEGIEIQGQLSSSSDVDWFQYTVTGAASLNLAFDLPSDSSYTDYFSIQILEDGDTIYSGVETGKDGSIKASIDEAGTYYVKVTSTDYYHDSGQYGLTLTEGFYDDNYEQEHNGYLNTNGSSSATGTRLTNNQTMSGQLFDSSDTDFYYINAAEPGSLTVLFDPLVDSSYTDYYKVTLQDSNFNTLSSFETGKDGELTAAVEAAGRYWAIVQATDYYHTDNVYGLTASVSSQTGTVETESNDTFATADDLTEGIEIQGQLSSSSDWDLFSIEISSPGAASLNFNTPTNSLSDYFFVGIYDQNYNLIDYQHSGKDISFSTSYISAGMYYVGVHASDYYNANSYSLLVNISQGEDYLTESEENNTFNSADRLQLGTEIIGQLSSSTDWDVFKFTLNSSGLVTAVFDAPTESTSDYFFVGLYNSEYEIIAANYTGRDLTFSTGVDQVGVYYAAVYTGSNHTDERYGLTVSSQVTGLSDFETETNDTFEAADNIDVGSAVKGQLLSENDWDVFKVELDSAGTLSVSFDAPTNSYNDYFFVGIYDSDFERLATEQSGKDFSISADIVNRGTYYAAVHSGTYYNNENYKFSTSFAVSQDDDQLDGVIYGTKNSDILHGSSSEDKFSYLGGNDIIFGGLGVDSFTIHGVAASEFGVKVINNLTSISSLSSSTYGNVHIRALDIEKVIWAGSELATANLSKSFYNEKSLIFGTVLDDTLTGTSESDIFDGLSGNDLIDGEEGEDTVVFFQNSNQAQISGIDGVYRVSSNNDQSEYYASIFKLSNVEKLALLDQEISLDVPEVTGLQIFTDADDSIIGNQTNNVIDGGGGSDVIDGKLGQDTVLFFTSINDAQISIDQQSGITKVSYQDVAQHEYAFSTTLLKSIEKIKFIDGNFDIVTDQLYSFSVSGSDMVEGGDGLTFEMSLNSKPTATVNVGLNSDNINFDTNTLTFSKANWDQPQSVKLTVPDNDTYQGSRDYSVSINLNSDDANFNIEEREKFKIKVKDNEAPDFVDFIQGRAWEDSDKDTDLDLNEGGIENLKVYLDLNNNGVFDSTDSYTFTDGNGFYSFTDLEIGTYSVGIADDYGWQYTFPSKTAAGANATAISHTIENFSTDSTSYFQDISNLKFSLRPELEQQYSSLDGQGQTVVIIDSGIDTDHEFFGSDDNRDGISDRIIFSKTFGDGKANGEDVDGHGTHVAGIVASSDDDFTGVAPGADIISLKVFDTYGANLIEKALNWCIENAAAYSIDVINMSLGNSWFFQSDSSYYLDYIGYGDEFKTLSDLGVVCIASAGNSFAGVRDRATGEYIDYPVLDGNGVYDYYWAEAGTHSTQGVASPAAYPEVISVGATWGGPDQHSWGSFNSNNGAPNAGSIVHFSQRDDELLDLFAIGGGITSAKMGGGETVMSGTSMAAPYVSGLVLLMQQLAEQELGRKLSPAEVKLIVNTQSNQNFDGDDEDYNQQNPTNLYYNDASINNWLSHIKTLKNPLFHSVDLASSEGEHNFGLVSSRINSFTNESEQIIISNAGAETYGAGGSDYIIGSTGDDTLYGGVGDDVIAADAGNDTIVGGEGDDWLSGGAGSDTFKYEKGDGNDTITDWHKTDDVIEYSGFSDYELTLSTETIISASEKTITLIDGSIITFLSNVTVNDDYGNDSSGATSVSLGDTIAGSIENISDEDWFSMALEAGKTYLFETLSDSLSDVTPYLVIYDPEERFEDGTASKISFQPETSGTYFLKLTDLGDLDTGSYSFTTNIVGALANDAPTGSLVISGTAAEGATLTLDTSSIDDVDGVGTFSYVWMKDGAVLAGETGSTYTLTQADVGSVFSASVSYVDGLGVTETLSAEATAAVANVNDYPTGSLALSGTLEKGSTLTLDSSSIADEDGLGEFSITWLSDDTPIAGSTGATYTLSADEVGKTISAAIEYTDGQGTVETVTSSKTSAVKDVIVESIGAISAVNTGSGSNMVLEFYADDSLVGASVTSFDAVVTFDTAAASYASVEIETGYLGFPNEADGVINLSGISLSGGSSADPLFTLTLTDQNTSEDLALYVSDVLINNETLAGSTLIFSSGPITESIGAISALNTGSGTNVSLDFYVDTALIPEDVSSFDMVVRFDSNGAEYVSADLGNFLGFPNASGDTITLSGISLSGVSSSDLLFTLNFTDLDASEDFAVFVSDVLVNGTSLQGSTLLIGEPDTFDVSTTVATRSGIKIPDVSIAYNDGNETTSVLSGSDGVSMTSITSGSDVTISGSFDYDTATKSINSIDALDALRLSVGMDTQSGTNTAFDYIAADFNQDGKVSSQDALEILKYAVGLPTTEQAEWVFVDTTDDYSDISRTNTNYDEGINIADLTSATELSLTGILIGDVNDSYSGLIA